MVPNRMYNNGLRDADNGGSSGGAGVLPTVQLTPNAMYAPHLPTVQLTPNVMYAPHTGANEESERKSTLYAIPMEAGADAGVDVGAGEVYSTVIEPGKVMYVTALNQDNPEYATAAANDTLYSVVNRAPHDGSGSGTTANVNATTIPAEGVDQNNHYDVGVPRRVDVEQNNHYDVGVPRHRADVEAGDDYSTVA